MQGEADLTKLISSMHPVLKEGVYVFCTIPRDAETAGGVHPFAVIHEDEGTTLILDRIEAQSAGLFCGEIFRRITLSVHSSLTAVGLTAAVSAALAHEGISANVVAGYYHDHIFVPEKCAQRALDILNELARRGSRTEMKGEQDEGQHQKIL